MTKTKEDRREVRRLKRERIKKLLKTLIKYQPTIPIKEQSQ
jgi:hypothetical protein